MEAKVVDSRANQGAAVTTVVQFFLPTPLCWIFLMGGGEKGESKESQMSARAHDDRSTAAAANSKATVKAHESGEQSEEGAPLKSSMQDTSAEFALKSESELQASRNTEEATLEAETTESAAAMNKLVRVDDNAAQAAIQLRQQAIERGKRIFEKR